MRPRAMSTEAAQQFHVADHFINPDLDTDHLKKTSKILIRKKRVEII